MVEKNLGTCNHAFVWQEGSWRKDNTWGEGQRFSGEVKQGPSKEERRPKESQGVTTLSKSKKELKSRNRTGCESRSELEISAD